MILVKLNNPLGKGIFQDADVIIQVLEAPELGRQCLGTCPFPKPSKFFLRMICYFRHFGGKHFLGLLDFLNYF